MAGDLKNTMDKVTDTVGGMARRASASMTMTADSFVESAAISDRYEIAAARLAYGRSRNEHVRAVAQKMIDDHTTSTHQLMAALEMNETKDVSPPPQELDTRRQTMLKHLEDAKDDQFDSSYLDQQVLAHQEALTLMETYGDRGDNAQLRSFAMATAPVIGRHLAHMKEIRRTL